MLLGRTGFKIIIERGSISSSSSSRRGGGIGPTCRTLSNKIDTLSSFHQLRIRSSSSRSSLVSPFQSLDRRRPIMTTPTTPTTPADPDISTDETIYQPYLLSPIPGASKGPDGQPIVDDPTTTPDWVDQLELSQVKRMTRDLFHSTPSGRRIKVLVLYGSLRERSFSRLMALEASRILHSIGCDVKVFNPEGLPIKDEKSEGCGKVRELRALAGWSDAHFWCSPEQHGNVTAVFKNQIDWIPLSVGSVRPTQGRTVGLAQINGGSQSFNTLSFLRNLGRWMRMFVIPNQSSLPLAWKCFTPSGRLMPSSNRDRLVDVCEELVKFTILLIPHTEVLGDRYSEREERRVKGRLLTQAEKESGKDEEMDKDKEKDEKRLGALHLAHTE